MYCHSVFLSNSTLLDFSGSCQTEGSNQSSMYTIPGIEKGNTHSSEPTETGFFPL